MRNNLPEVIVGAVILNPLGQVFLMSGTKWQERLIVPGGHVEFGEGLEAALYREIQEETGFSISGIRFVNVDEMIGDERHFVFVNYLCNYAGGELTLDGEGMDGDFLDFEVAFESNLAAPTRRLLESVHRLLKEQRLD